MTGWLDATELRVGLGCMRLPSDEEEAFATIVAAAEAGATVFDTARAYPGSERLLARALRGRAVRVVTKGGMARPEGRWVPDGRAKTLRQDCEASLEALDGLPIDLYLVHAPDPRTSWRTTVRALATLLDDGLVRRVGVANVNRRQLDEALELAPIAAVQVAVSVYDDRAIRGGVVARCEERGVTVIAHSPLGGPRRIARLRRDPTLRGLAASAGASPEQVALAWLLDRSPSLVAIPGARTVEAARSAVRAASLDIDTSSVSGSRARRVAQQDGDVVLLMGIPGAGKSRAAERFVGQGYARLNRDELGGTLLEVADALDALLRRGETRVVLDNTYLTRAQRSRAIEAAAGHGLPVSCLWVDTPLAQAQVNMVERLLRLFGSLPDPDELRRRAREEPGLHTPTSQMRAARELEEPDEDEGFERVERIAFERADPAEATGVFVAAPALERPGWRRAVSQASPAAPHLVFDWRPGESDDTAAAAALSLLAESVVGPVEHAVCVHPGGPPVCWCRPPLPGLVLDFAGRHGISPARSFVVGVSATHRALAHTLGATFIET
jgi:aryl-alcohol dehydrogenase-like predicted oxidoreductase